MSSVLDLAAKFLNHHIQVQVYSNPNFFIELIVSFFMALVHLLLIVEVDRVIGEVNVPPIRIRVKESLKAIDSSRSVYKKVVRNHPELGVDVIFKQNSVTRNDWDTMAKINKVLSTSLSGYIRRDLNKIKSRIKVEAGDDNARLMSPRGQTSTDKIYDYLLREPELQERLATHQEGAAEGGSPYPPDQIRRLF